MRKLNFQSSELRIVRVEKKCLVLKQNYICINVQELFVLLETIEKNEKLTAIVLFEGIFYQNATVYLYKTAVIHKIEKSIQWLPQQKS